MHETLQQKVSEETNRNLPARNTLVQPLALYTDPRSHNVQRYRQTDRQTVYTLLTSRPPLNVA